MFKSTQNPWNEQFLKTSPLFFPLFPFGGFFQNFKSWPDIKDYNEFLLSPLTTWTGIPLSFVPQKQLRRKKPSKFSDLYEMQIFLTGMVNTRLQNWHDFFNMLVWHTFPKTKAALNMRQFIAFDENMSFPWLSAPLSRLREQDYMTMFDEGGCLLLSFAGPGDEKILFPLIFGHGAYEQIYFGQCEISLCTVSLELSFPEGDEDLSLLLERVDRMASALLSRRETFAEGNTPFFSLPLSEINRLCKQFLSAFPQYRP